MAASAGSKTDFGLSNLASLSESERIQLLAVMQKAKVKSIFPFLSNIVIVTYMTVNDLQTLRPQDSSTVFNPQAQATVYAQWSHSIILV